MMEVEIHVALTNQLNILLFVLFYFRLYFILFSGIEMTLNLNTTTPIQDAQGRWYELLSPTQVLTGDNEIKSPSRKNKGYDDREVEACIMKASLKRAWSTAFLPSRTWMKEAWDKAASSL